ncbi:MAG: primosomal protein N' [Bacteroidia bacterium]|nr:primosomal protein N' [Bacteroidia bacterium]
MYVDVILPLPLPGMFTYAVPAEMQPCTMAGQRVVVPFGKRKHYTGIIARIHDRPQTGFTVREIHSLTDDHPVVTPQQLKLWEWIAFYYQCSLGDVCKAALPSFMKPEDLATRYLPKVKRFYRINNEIDSPTRSALLSRAKKQGTLFQSVRTFLCDRKQEMISRQELTSLPDYTPSLLKGLTGKEILIEESRQESRLTKGSEPLREPYPLSHYQQLAMEQVTALLPGKKTVLLHGVTSGGKTEIYIHLINRTLNEGKQTLYLLPEIALTTQLTQRLHNVFGDKLGIYHSGIGDNERTEIWLKMLSDHPYQIIIGARSSLFLPFRDLGLVIVDEEHETSYKQQDPAPRYHARDTAIMLAHLSGAKTVLGSATPSVESYYNTVTGKYGLVNLTERFNGMMMPSVQLENTRELRMRKKMKSILSPALINEMAAALEKGEQVILFRNRRGFSSVLECSECAWTPRCTHCDVSLTLHKHPQRLVCHYCNRSYPLPEVCPSCGGEKLEPLGAGTEQLEEEVRSLFPDHNVMRMDADTTRGKQAYEKIIRAFEERKAEILVGTQMLSKGLDFDHVRVVGILSADALLNHPDFRSHERGFQLMTQAAGRSGRKNERGIVIIQTSDPQQSIFRHVVHHDYPGFFQAELNERKQFGYPPYTRLIRISVKHRNEALTESAASHLATRLRVELRERVLGPGKPPVGRIKLQYLREILLKLETGYSPQRVRHLLLREEESLHARPEYRYVTLSYDVDPM